MPHPSRHFAMGGMQSAHSATTPLSLPFSSQPQKPVISTEAAHGPIVSSAAEKSASLPKQHLSHCRVFAVARVFRRCCCLFSLGPSQDLSSSEGRREATESITFAFAVNFLLSF